MDGCYMWWFETKIKTWLFSIEIFPMRGEADESIMSWVAGWAALMLSGEPHNGDTVTMFCQRITQWTTGGGEIILLFGSNYTEGRGGRDYQIWSQFTTFQIQSESDANRVENLLSGTAALNCQQNLFQPLVILNKHGWSMKLSR